MKIRININITFLIKSKELNYLIHKLVDLPVSSDNTLNSSLKFNELLFYLAKMK